MQALGLQSGLGRGQHAGGGPAQAGGHSGSGRRRVNHGCAARCVRALRVHVGACRRRRWERRQEGGPGLSGVRQANGSLSHSFAPPVAGCLEGLARVRAWAASAAALAGRYCCWVLCCVHSVARLPTHAPRSPLHRPSVRAAAMPEWLRKIADFSSWWVVLCDTGTGGGRGAAAVAARAHAQRSTEARPLQRPRTPRMPAQRAHTHTLTRPHTLTQGPQVLPHLATTGV